MCLDQGHKAVKPVRLECATPQSRVKHSTTEPLASLDLKHDCQKHYRLVVYAYSDKPSLQNFHVMETRGIILYLSVYFQLSVELYIHVLSHTIILLGSA